MSLVLGEQGAEKKGALQHARAMSSVEIALCGSKIDGPYLAR